MSSRAASVPEEQFDIDPSLVGLAVMALYNTIMPATFVFSNQAVPDQYRLNPRELLRSKKRCPPGRSALSTAFATIRRSPRHGTWLGASYFTRDQLYWFRKPGTPQLSPKDAQRQFSSSLAKLVRFAWPASVQRSARFEDFELVLQG